MFVEDQCDLKKMRDSPKQFILKAAHSGCACMEQAAKCRPHIGKFLPKFYKNITYKTNINRSYAVPTRYKKRMVKAKDFKFINVNC